MRHAWHGRQRCRSSAASAHGRGPRRCHSSRGHIRAHCVRWARCARGGRLTGWRAANRRRRGLRRRHERPPWCPADHASRLHVQLRQLPHQQPARASAPGPVRLLCRENWSGAGRWTQRASGPGPGGPSLGRVVLIAQRIAERPGRVHRRVCCLQVAERGRAAECRAPAAPSWCRTSVGARPLCPRVRRRKPDPRHCIGLPGRCSGGRGGWRRGHGACPTPLEGRSQLTSHGRHAGAQRNLPPGLRSRLHAVRPGPARGGRALCAGLERYRRGLSC
mmetsp:Transcript_10447/g.40619  ORF Transcript_10447/g.40619 Transcript_10447/m.40619 type:complete len:276 (+) Transcript_10447:1134-1961(+)